MEWFAGGVIGVVFGLVSPQTPRWLTFLAVVALLLLALVTVVLDTHDRRLRRRLVDAARPTQHHHVLVLHSDAPYDWAADDPTDNGGDQ